MNAIERELRFWSYVDIRADEECWPWVGATDGRGYGRFWFDGRTIQAHRFAYEAALGETIPADHYGCHSCDYPPCCNPAHVWPGTHADNVADCVAKGRQSRGERQHCAKLTSEQVAAIKCHYEAGGVTMEEVGALFGVGKQAVCDIVRGKTWKHTRAEGDIPQVQEGKAKGHRNGSRLHPERLPRGSQHPQAKVNEWQVIGIMARWLQGVPQVRLAQEFAVCKQTIHNIVNGRAWRHLFAEVA
jgi:hypothetical protein